MNIPSAQSIAAITEVLELAHLIDSRVPRPDKARIMAWARQIDRHNLTRDDMLDAVQAFYDHPSSQSISVGDVIEGARRIKRARLEKEADQDRDERRTGLDSKAADEMRAISAAVISGRIKNRNPRLEAAERALQTCYGKQESMAAIREYLAAKAEAGGRKKPTQMTKAGQP